MIKTKNAACPAAVHVKEHGLAAKIGKELSKNKNLYLLSIPIVVYFALFCYGPMFGLIIAFKNYQIAKGVLGSEWVGFKYFIEFFQSTYFTRTLSNTLIISIYDILFNFPAPVIFALLLNELRGRRFKKTVQTITYLPHFISMVVICGMISDFFSSDGIITNLLVLFGGEKMNYLGSAKHFRTIYIVTNIWQGVGWGSIIYCAALSGIDQELYEAAAVDGASKLRQTFCITLPGIAPTIIIMLIMRIGQLLNVGYEKIILLYSPSTYETADVISSFVYRRGIGQSAQYSYSAAVGMFQSVINFILLLLANGVSRKVTNTGLF